MSVFRGFISLKSARRVQRRFDSFIFYLPCAYILFSKMVFISLKSLQHKLKLCVSQVTTMTDKIIYTVLEKRPASLFPLRNNAFHVTYMHIT